MPAPFTHGQRRPSLFTMNDPRPSQSLQAPRTTTPPNLLKPAPVDPAYANVLKFPETPEYVKYFENNPHFGRFPDKDLAIWEVFHKDDLKFDRVQKKMELELVKRELGPRLSDMDRKLMLMPGVVEKQMQEATSNTWRIGLRHLSDALLNYLVTSLDRGVVPTPLFIDYGFATDTRVAQNALKDLSANLLNIEGTKALIKHLTLSGAFTQEEKIFHLWNAPPTFWPTLSTQSRPVLYYDPAKAASYPNLLSVILPQYLALGNHTIHAIPEGVVKSLGGNEYEICVNKFYYTIVDYFNFEGPEFLGYWPLNPEEEARSGINTNIGLFNGYFRDYKKTGYGRDFPVFSKLHEAEDFQPTCLRYTHAK